MNKVFLLDTEWYTPCLLQMQYHYLRVLKSFKIHTLEYKVDFDQLFYLYRFPFRPLHQPQFVKFVSIS